MAGNKESIVRPTFVDNIDPEGKVVVKDNKTGKEIKVWPVDAKEMVASGDYSHGEGSPIGLDFESEYNGERTVSGATNNTFTDPRGSKDGLSKDQGKDKPEPKDATKTGNKPEPKDKKDK